MGFFERHLTVRVLVCIGIGTVLGKFAPDVALATVVGVLIEVPLMLMLVRFCLSPQGWFRHA